MKKIILFPILVILLVVIIVVAVVFSNKITLSPTDKFLQTSDGEKIAFDQYKTGHENVLILAPGWFMCKSSKPFAEMALDFSKDFDVIALDFRGHCKSSGKFTFTSREYNDLNTVINYAKNDYKKVYVAGFSLGGATAVITQFKFKNADKIILISAPADFDEIENAVWKKEAFIPTFQKFEIKTWANITSGELWLKKIKPTEVISEISPTPVLIIAGMKDPTVSVKHAKKLYRSAKEPKKLVIFGDSIHAEDIYLQNKERFVKLCTDWLLDKENLSR